MTTRRKVLLVGEGNFSFSAALCQTAEDRVRVTATCLQSEEVARRQDSAEENLQRLKECGAEVYFHVDCTRLTECETLSQQLFDCIIFNFPHCGRKSGVKKNRSLLAKFFHSCVQVLTQSGEVHVALCNGQGGTPVDKPIREWHNSWQAVAMAAEAGLILSDICPFDRDKYQSYKCSGYRSQDKGFHVEGALTHTFTRSLPYTALQRVKMEALLGRETVLFEIPEELSEYVNRDFLRPQSRHPVRIVQEQLLRELQSDGPVRALEVEWPELFRNSPERLGACGPEVAPSEVYWIRPTGTRALGEEDAGAEEDRGSNSGQDGAARGYGLRPSLLTHVQELARREDFRPGVLHAVSGLVFRRAPVSRCGGSGAPAFHQLLLAGTFPDEPRPLLHLRGRLEALLAPHGFSFKEEEEEGGAPGPAGSAALLRARLASAVEPRPALPGSLPPESPGPFRSFSLYPPAYTHDISFWVEPDSFDELEFHALVRRVSAGAVREVALVDRFRHPHMGHASLCYRLTYQSSDRALSRSQALGMQLKLRQLLPLQLQVTLR
ncbi:hypothetical protein ANANG_G00154720 [Anguilla anguilla]|uniref:phenylalanine--tRNA ligase n=1 Tax=Anguilla anguilla TaxID=7936 RepID=A0A9D3M7A8_ANGAN|nr:hypothetical protein ANANG_G00154720 [Anguilla anguilla]